MALRDLRLTALGTTVTGTLDTVLNVRGNLYQGRVQTTRFASESLMKAFAAQLPPGLTSDELGMLELSASFTLDSAADSLTVQPLRAEAFGLRMSGSAAARNLSTAATWTGTGAIAQFSPQELLQRFGLPPQQTSDPRAFTRPSVDTRFTITKDGAQLDDLVLALDETTIKGDFTMQGFVTPAYRFTLNVDAVDADRYLPPKARDAEGGEATAGDIELPQNNTMDLDGTLRVGSLGLAGLQFTDVGGRVVIGGGDLTIEDARAKLYGGTFDGRFHVRAAGNAPGLTLEGRAAGLQLAPLITALTAEAANVSGTGSFDLSLSGKGRTVIENVQTAGGNVSFNMDTEVKIEDGVKVIKGEPPAARVVEEVQALAHEPARADAHAVFAGGRHVPSLSVFLAARAFEKSGIFFNIKCRVNRHNAAGAVPGNFSVFPGPAHRQSQALPRRARSDSHGDEARP